MEALKSDVPSINRREFTIKLRNHPLMTRRSGLRAWPPLWIDTRGESYPKPIGELGYLKSVARHDSILNGLFIWVVHQKVTYVGMMNFDDPAFCREIHKVLLENVGREIKDIGDIDLSHLL